MSRKRAPPDPDATSERPNAKRHLNSALAAELQTLRISGNRDAASPPRHFFGASVTSSPFLTSSNPARFPTNYGNQTFPQHPFGQGSGVDLGTDFADTLVDEPFMSSSREPTPNPEVSTPGSSSSSSMSMALDDMDECDSGEFASHPIRLETSNDDVVVEDMEAPLNDENRLVVYRPPVKTSSDAFSRMNACLPDGRYLVRNPKTDEWIVKEVQHDRCKRKLALVPWRGGAKKLCDGAHRPAAVIQMPWHDSHPAVVDPEQDPEQVMEIEDIS